MCDRWTVAVHECGHAVSAVVLGGRCDRVTICPDGSGFASLRELPPFDLAVSQAAAAAATELLADTEPPKLEIRPEPIATTCSVQELDLESPSMAVLAASNPRAVFTDEQSIAQFCISGLEAEPPERWCERFYLVHETARRLVANHRRQILRLARELFRRGELYEHDISMELERA